MLQPGSYKKVFILINCFAEFMRNFQLKSILSITCIGNFLTAKLLFTLAQIVLELLLDQIHVGQNLVNFLVHSFHRSWHETIILNSFPFNALLKRLENRCEIMEQTIIFLQLMTQIDIHSLLIKLLFTRLYDVFEGCKCS